MIRAWAVLVALILVGCAGGPNTAAALRARQQAIQDCILSGGHAQLGPNDTILCAH